MTDLKTSSTAILGAAAEYYVMCELLRRQKIAALAPAGVPYADIIVSDRYGRALSAVQVKARRLGADGGWHMKAKHETIVGDLIFYCFVDFGSKLDPPKCWVLPSNIVATALCRSHKAWLEQPGRGGKAHNDHDMRRFRPDYSDLKLLGYGPDWLVPYYKRWDLIASASPGASGAPGFSNGDTTAAR